MEKKEKNNTLLIIIAIILFIVAIVFVVLTIKRNKDEEEFYIEGIEVTKNEDILKDTKVDNLDITSQALYKQETVTSYSAIVKNNTKEDYHIKELYVVFTIGEEKKKVLAIREATIKANDEKIINITFDSDMLDATKIEFEIEK